MIAARTRIGEVLLAGGPEVNLFVDHSQIVQPECLRASIWGTAGLWGRVLTSKE
jgi:phosphosulfolactate synthase (CoM biosynthesis protein A)